MKRRLQVMTQRNKLKLVVENMIEQEDATGVSVALAAVSMLNWVLDENDDMITAEINTTLNRLRVRVDKELAQALGKVATPKDEA